MTAQHKNSATYIWMIVSFIGIIVFLFGFVFFITRGRSMMWVVFIPILISWPAIFIPLLTNKRRKHAYSGRNSLIVNQIPDSYPSNPMEQRYCTNCGRLVQPKSFFCENCGARV